MRETISTAMPPCFDRWCKRFDNIFKTKAQKKEFRHYLGGLLGESERKNLSQMAEDTVDVSYHSLRHFLVRASWGEQQINDCRLELMKSCGQTKPSTGFSLIIDDSAHRKSGCAQSLESAPSSGNFTDGVGRQYIGKMSYLGITT